jgi:lysine 2,3-aminomutase
MKRLMPLSREEILDRIWRTEPRLKSILKDARHVEEGRYAFFDYIDRLRRDLYNMKSDTLYADLPIIEKRNVRECVRVLSNIMRTENEYLTNSSPITLLYDLAQNTEGAIGKVSKGFLIEMYTLLLGIRGKYVKQSRGELLPLNGLPSSILTER